MTLLRGALPNVNGACSANAPVSNQRSAVRSPPAKVRITQLIGPLRGSRADVGAIDPEVHGERRAALRDEDGVDAPAAQRGFDQAARSGKERQLDDAAGNELVPVVEARTRPFAGVVEDVPDVLRHIGLRLGRPRARGIVLRARQRVADVVGVVIPETALELDRCAVIDRFAVKPDRVDAAQRGDRPARLDRSGSRFRHVADGRVVGAERPRAHVGQLRASSPATARTAGRRSTSGCIRRCSRSP